MKPVGLLAAYQRSIVYSPRTGCSMGVGGAVLLEGVGCGASSLKFRASSLSGYQQIQRCLRHHACAHRLRWQVIVAKLGLLKNLFLTQKAPDRIVGGNYA